MLSYEDCVGLCELTEEEIAAIAAHEHIPSICAAELGNYLLHTPDGIPKLKKMIRDDIEEARARKDWLASGKLMLVLQHFIETHPEHMKRNAGKAGEHIRLSEIRLELARDKDFPEGSATHGYEFTVPLDVDGHIDAKAWKTLRNRCGVRRFWGTQAEEKGHLRHTKGRQWAFHYDVEGDEVHDETGVKFDRHTFKVGEYVSVLEQDGQIRTFKVASVRPA